MLMPLVIALLLLATGAYAEDRQPDPVDSAFSIRFENDAFGGTDENYTNGVSLGFTTRGKGLLGWVWDIGGRHEGERFSSYELTQLMFTPSDIERTSPDPNDRPYAGIAYWAGTTHLQREDSLHSLKLIAGVVGPASLTEQGQRLTHELFGYNNPHGWGSQLKNEPVLNFVYEYRRRLRLTSSDLPVSVELIPMAGGFLGNYLVQGEAGAQLRVGYNPGDFGVSLLRGISYLPFPQERPHREWGVYVYAGGTANIVGHNLTLDGNTFTKSPSVERRVFLPAAEFGSSLWTRWFQATFSYAMMGREFYGQSKREDYGSVLLTFFFR